MNQDIVTIVLGILSALGVIGEALSLTDRFKANGVIQAVTAILKAIGKRQ